MVVNSFLQEYVPVTGMPQLYSQLHETLNRSGFPPSYHYVSSSPWQLGLALEQFLYPLYPLGELYLQSFDFSPSAFKQFMEVENFKRGRFDQLRQKFPLKRWYLIGDSGQKDPEIYAGIYEAYGEQAIECIWIVKTTGTDADKEQKLNADERFNTTFAKVPRERWFAFDNAEQVSGLPVGQCRP